jgi:hypothetical protein
MLVECKYLDASKLFDGIYILGTLQKGVTAYNQQVRALNLVYALCKSGVPMESIKSVAVIGGGIGGLMLAASVAAMTKAKISLFEQHADLCPLQQGCDTRWLHPHIYAWPELGSRQPSALLPFLQWREGRASDVASEVLRRFAEVCKFKSEKLNMAGRISVFVDVKEIKIDQTKKEISWVGFETADFGGFSRKTAGVGKSEKFDLILLAVGFGRERPARAGSQQLYWQNDDLSQPRLTEESRTFLVSGSGDGALVDLFRLTIERFRQDRIVYEIFDGNLDEIECAIRKEIATREESMKNSSKPESWWAFFERLEKKSESKSVHLSESIDLLKSRLRKDTRVILHVSGPSKKIRSMEGALEQKSSFLNKLLTYMLYRCGAFIPSFRGLEETIKRFGPHRRDIICRHGTDSVGTICDLFLDDIPNELFDDLRNRQQSPAPLWPPGYFPTIPNSHL